ncbi:hypothetical protein halTADL_1002 [Halohasta litchfieldiae]|jgi:hypothetical protein|uniref:DUF456 domain-containing protein n=1 Tax=Halohasta litchfieldiae TaxID=1073996 RepID=A0A1H6WDG1_9EURY|nr:DUF456 domain-containing protein [Halohasta litchfieldiae]ATW87797.1 hypothetical protein halTADL_1002 [Halohasta litchfieldiae]SEJ15059.1 hypothetical protein SAMN05444271_12521 [Halohasta litchfieldiae]
MVELVLVVAVVLLIVGVVGSVLPLVPSGLVSLAGVWTYVLFGSEPVGVFVVVSLTLAGIAAVLFDHFAGPIAARASGASTETMIASTIGGLVMLLVLGPIGIIVGVVGTVFLLELRNGSEMDIATKRALYTTVGVLASSVVQVLVTLSMLGAFVLFVVVF